MEDRRELVGKDEGVEGQWADDVAHGAKLKEFASLLGATGGADSITIDLSFGVDDGDEESGRGTSMDCARSTDGAIDGVGRKPM